MSPDSGQAAAPRGSSRSASPAKRALWFLLAALFVAALVGAAAVARARAGLEEARRFADEERWRDVTNSLSLYLRIWPEDAEARLLAAQALTGSLQEGEGGAVAAKRAVAEALAHLDRIRDEAQQGPEARLRASRLLLAVMERPAAAEAQLRRAINREPDNRAAHLLLWQILDLTRRSDWAEPAFREVIRLTSPEGRLTFLQRWHLSQFDPAAVNQEFDRMLGILPAGNLPDGRTELLRYRKFQKAEPDCPIHIAAEARLLLRNNETRRAVELFDSFENNTAFTDPFFAAMRVRAAHAVGDTATFERVLERWPASSNGYEYHKWHGVQLDEYRDDPAAAVASYRRALAIWPGTLDWQLLFRLSRCLRRLGRIDEAEQARLQSESIEQLIGDEAQRGVRESLARSSEPAAAERVAAFYDAIGRRWEAGLWLEQAAQAGPLSQ